MKELRNGNKKNNKKVCQKEIDTSMPETDLTTQIANELRKSGYPLEIKCKQICRKHGWPISPSLYYIDSNNSERSVDVRGLRVDTFSSPDSKYISCVSNFLLIECKKNVSNHWVFFTDVEQGAELNFSSNTEPRCYPTDFGYLVGPDLKKHHYNDSTKTVIDYSMFKITEDREQEKNQIYQAVRQVTEAYVWERSVMSGFSSPTINHQLCTDIYYPVLVLEGRLFSTTVKGDDVNVIERDHLIYVAKHLNRPECPTTIDIVKYSYLPE